MAKLAMMPARFAAVTKSDATTHNPPIDGLFVGAAGNVVAVGEDDVEATFVAPAGVTLMGPFKQIKDATTADNLVGYWGD